MAVVNALLNLFNSPSLGVLTEKRNFGAVTFLGRYGLADVMLSNFSNSGIDRIVVLAENNLSAVFNHTQQGNVWINNTKTGFLRIAMNEKLIEASKFNTDIANIEAHYSIIEDTNPDIIVVAPTFFLYSFDFRKMIEFHEESGAEITCLYVKTTKGDKEYLNCDSLQIEKNHIINHSKTNVGEDKTQNISLETFIFNREAFDKILAMSHKVSSMYGLRKCVSYAINRHRFITKAYRFDGYVVPILTYSDYVNKSFELLAYANRQKLFFPDWPIYTTTHNTPPALYGKNASVENSFVANGSIIKGCVENSIISRDVVIEEGAVVKDCIVFTKTQIGKDAHLQYVLADKNVKILEVKELQGQKNDVLFIRQGEKI